MYWELWDVESRNLVEDFATEEEALQAIREILAVNRPDYIDCLALAAMYEEGEPREAELSPALRGEALRARLAESATPPVIDEASREVHGRIRKWLAEENWDVRKVDDPQTSFNVMATLQRGPNVNVFQYKDHVDQITLSQHWLYDNGFRSAIGQLPGDVLRNTVWNIYRDVSLMGVEFYGLDTPSTEMTIRAYVYFDGLTKDTFIQRILLTIRALHLAFRTFIRVLEEHSRSEGGDSSAAIQTFLRVLEERDQPAEDVSTAGHVQAIEHAPIVDKPPLSREELKEIMRQVPRTYGQLTAAS